MDLAIGGHREDRPRDPGSAGASAHEVVLGASYEIAVRLKPRGSRDELLGMRDAVLEAKVTAPPVDGRANKALCKLIAKRVGVAPSRVSVVRGAKSREKVVRVEGVKKEAVDAALEGL